MKMTLNIFYKLKTLMQRIICVKNKFIQKPSKMTIELSKWYFLVSHEQNQHLPQLKSYSISEYKNFWTVQLCFCSLFILNWRRFVLHKTILIKWRKNPPLIISCHKFRGTCHTQPSWNKSCTYNLLYFPAW